MNDVYYSSYDVGTQGLKSIPGLRGMHLLETIFVSIIHCRKSYQKSLEYSNRNMDNGWMYWSEGHSHPSDGLCSRAGHQWKIGLAGFHYPAESTSTQGP